MSTTTATHWQSNVITITLTIVLSLLLLGLLTTAQASKQPEMTLDHHIRHGLFFSISNDFNADITGKHLAGINTYPYVAPRKATINGDVSGIKSVGYNLKYTPNKKLGLGVEFGVYYSNTRVPSQNSTLRGTDGQTLTHPLPGEGLQPRDPFGRGLLVVSSPSSYMQTADFYMGALYSFPEFTVFDSVYGKVTPYVGAGYTRVLGRWHRSFYSPDNPNDYGKKGSTAVNGYYTSGKIGVHFLKHCSLEGEYAVYDLDADAFRSFNINGSDIEYDRFSLNLIINF